METITGIAETFKNRTALITGSTGFVGKLLTEKLLRSCSMKYVAIIVRNKKGIDSKKRMDNIYRNPLFDRLRKEKSNFIDCIKIINGDLLEPSLGLSDSDRDWLIQNVNFVFHCAATIKFNESLEVATKINVQGTERLMIIASAMKNLQGFVHVSTAYSHCMRSEIDEKFYPMTITAKELKRRLKKNKEYNDVENWPNTYSYTKAITENLLSKNEYKLPISVFRPSIIICTKSEPSPGWLENINGPTGMATGAMVGFLRTFPAGYDKVTDIIPADYTINGLIGVMWDTVNRYKDHNEIDKEPKIYNYVSSVESPLIGGNCDKEMRIHYYDAPPLQAIWYTFSIPYTQLWIGTVLRFFLHKIPGSIFDLALIISGKRPKMLRMYAKTDESMNLYHMFTTREWKFYNKNTRELWLSQCQDDRQTFPFGFEHFDWSSFLKSFYYGIREHILKEDLSNKEKALAKNRKLFYLHYFFLAFVVYLLYKVCWIFIKHFV